MKTAIFCIVRVEEAIDPGSEIFVVRRDCSQLRHREQLIMSSESRPIQDIRSETLEDRRIDSSSTNVCFLLPGQIGFNHSNKYR